MLTAEVRRVLADTRRGMTAEELAAALGHEARTVQRVAAGMARREELLLIEAEPDPVYGLPQESAACTF